MINAAAAGKFLDQVGKHVDIQAFKDKVDLTLDTSESLAELLAKAANE